MEQFEDRDDAGRQLAAALATKGYEHPIVLGIPRGGVPVAARVASALDGDLGVVVARKLRAPGQPELAVGAVTAEGVAWINEQLAEETGAGPHYLEREIAFQTSEARRRERAFDGHRRPPVTDRVVIIIDDGIATGATALAAARAMRAAGAGRVVIAVPVSPPRTVERLRAESDDVVALRGEEDFWAIGQFYRDFDQIDDGDVSRILETFRDTRAIRRSAWVTRDGIRLAVRLALPRAGAPVAVFVHGLGSSKDSPRNVVIAEQLLDAGIGFVLFDLSGHGESSPDPRDNEDAYIDDLVAVVAWAAAQPEVDPSRIAVAGSSLGAVVALRAVQGGRLRPAALVLRAPPAAPADYAGLDIPALLLIGSRDSLLEDARQAAAAASVELRVIAGASHLFEEPGTLEQAAEATVGWLAAQLATEAPSAFPPGADRLAT